MPEVTPFRAIRFDYNQLKGDFSSVLAPPYDVLDQVDKDALLGHSDHNIVAIDLPHIPPKSKGPDEAYAQSAKLLSDWLADGALVRESSPAIYVYHQIFEHDGKTFTRKKFIARVRLHDFSDGVVLPHERTFGGPKEDRLALMQSTKCQLSPIFGLYADPENLVHQALSGTVSQPPQATATMNHVLNQFWVVTDAGIIDTVVTSLADKKIYIADGHHRYSTALSYRDWACEQSSGSLPEDHPANYVMFVLASMDDPGCVILPYHRALANVNIKQVLEAWQRGVEPTSADDADLVLHNGAGEEVAVKFTNRAALRRLSPDHVEPWYDLDTAYLHRYLIDDLLQNALGGEPNVHYAKSAGQAKRIAENESGVALLVNATPMSHLRAVSDAGGLMPQKSTYFHPKLATGLAISPLE